MLMWSLIGYRRTTLASPHVRNVRESNGVLWILVRSFVISGSRGFSSVKGVDGCDALNKRSKHKGQKPSFAESYFVKYCGFSPESAKSRAKLVHFSSPERPDAVLKLLKNYGFTLNQINRVVNTCPPLLLCSAEEIILPKLEFVGSIGFSDDERTRFITSCPRILSASLENMLMPSHKALTTLLTSDEIIQCLKRSSRMLLLDVQKHLAAKISVLSSHGLPQTHMRALIKVAPRVLSYPEFKFEEIVKRVISFGFETTKLKFVYAVAVISQQQESTWQQKVSAFKSLGLPEEHVLDAFKLCPVYMANSEKKLRSAMDFYVNEMGMSPSFLTKNPAILGLSLEKRVRPRCLVMSVLASAGFLKKDTLYYPYILLLSEKKFMDRFVTKYCEKLPRLLDVFHGKSSSS